MSLALLVPTDAVAGIVMVLFIGDTGAPNVGKAADIVFEFCITISLVSNVLLLL
jgi:hypothetical protein